eukprot:1180119-Prorocentrum_minimum.AAC.3
MSRSCLAWRSCNRTLGDEGVMAPSEVTRGLLLCHAAASPGRAVIGLLEVRECRRMPGTMTRRRA